MQWEPLFVVTFRVLFFLALQHTTVATAIVPATAIRLLGVSANFTDAQPPQDLAMKHQKQLF